MIPRPSTTCDPDRRHHAFIDGADRCRCGALGQPGAVAPDASHETPLARIGSEHGVRVVEALAAYTVALWLAPRTPCSHARARLVPAGLWCPDCGGHRDRSDSPLTLAVAAAVELARR